MKLLFQRQSNQWRHKLSLTILDQVATLHETSVEIALQCTDHNPVQERMVVRREDLRGGKKVF